MTDHYFKFTTEKDIPAQLAVTNKKYAVVPGLHFKFPVRILSAFEVDTSNKPGVSPDDKKLKRENQYK